jgi:hypothetical protein
MLPESDAWEQACRLEAYCIDNFNRGTWRNNGLYFAFKNQADVGWNLEVKHTPWKAGCLILRDRDRADDIAVLVTGNSPNYYIIGWIVIGMARRPSRKRGDGSYWINPSDLNPIENLNRSIYARNYQA